MILLLQTTYYFTQLTATYNLIEALLRAEREAVREHMLDTEDDQIQRLCIELLCELYQIFSPSKSHHIITRGVSALRQCGGLFDRTPKSD